MKKIFFLMILFIFFVPLDVFAISYGSAEQSFNAWNNVCTHKMTKYCVVHGSDGYYYLLLCDDNADLTIDVGDNNAATIRYKGLDYYSIFYYISNVNYNNGNGWPLQESNILIYSHDVDQSPAGNNVTIIESNCIIYNYDTGEEYYNPNPSYEDYYIDDNANLFNEGQINSILAIEKKWEQNLNMQFFIKTYTQNISNEVQDLVSFGNSKSPSGNGSITLYINKKTDGTYRYGIGISSRAGLSLPYGEFNHNKIYYDMKGALGTNFGLLQLINFLDLEYSNILYKPQDFNFGKEIDDGMWYGFWKSKRPMFDNSATNWELRNGKISEVKDRETIESFIWQDPQDKYYWVWEQLDWDMDINQTYGVADGYHVWFGDKPLQPTPGPSVTPHPGAGSEPTTNPVVTPGVTPLPEDPLDGELGINPQQLSIKSKLPTGQLEGALSRLNEIHASTVPPVLKINLRTLLNAGVSHIAPDLVNALPDQDMEWVDFGQLEVVQFGGISLIQYFRTLIGSLMIFFTLRSIWKTIIPSKAISD